jgi:hypothetical protein
MPVRLIPAGIFYGTEYIRTLEILLFPRPLFQDYDNIFNIVGKVIKETKLLTMTALA